MNTIIMDIVSPFLGHVLIMDMVGTWRDAVSIAMMAKTIMGTVLILIAQMAMTNSDIAYFYRVKEIWTISGTASSRRRRSVRLSCLITIATA